MSDTMLYGVLRMPYEMAMEGEIARLQFYNRAQEAADRLEVAERRLAEIDAASASPSPASDAELPPDDELRELAARADKAALEAWSADESGTIRRVWQLRKFYELCARAASTRTASEPDDLQTDELVGAMYALRHIAAGGDDPAKCAQLALDVLATLSKIRAASDTRTAAGEAECDAARRAAPASQHKFVRATPGESRIEAQQDWIGNVTVKAFIHADDLADLSHDPVARLLLNKGSAQTASDWCLLMESVFHAQSKTAGSAREGGNTQPVSVESTRPAEVDVEAERKLFEAVELARGTDDLSPGFGFFSKGQYANPAVENRWQGWLAKARTQAAARTQADAGKDKALLDYLDKWVIVNEKQGYKWFTFSFDANKTAREQIKAEMMNLAATKPENT